MKVSILKHEKKILPNSEKRASDEVLILSERVHRLQASLDTIQSTEEVREEELQLALFRISCGQNLVMDRCV
ncbi:hypothetical protein CASFOL_034529 [Castilleja foliolosa]|uniref:Uncharacterized protein n=1 Tax=Castilleja foliolosa TaxID=1961234 RepID=A0ABD3BQS5_9LAMI